MPRFVPLAVFLATAIALYGNTLGHEYALDDHVVITDNEYVQQGVRGIPALLTTDHFAGFFGDRTNLVQGGRYRPLSLITFAVERQLVGNDPAVSHAINVLLYGLAGWLLFLLLAQWTPGRPWIAWIGALVFLVHPIHTEVVANIKGRDEILALALGLLSLLWVMRERAVAGGIAFFLALLAKESVFPLLAVAPVAVFVFARTTWRDAIVRAVPIAVAAAAYLALRFSIVGGLGSASVQDVLNDPFLDATWSQRTATVFLTLARYLQLLVWPHPLTHDYYYAHVDLVSWAHPLARLGLILYAALGVLALVALRRRSALGFAVSFYLLTLSVVSNLFFTVGVSMSERFLFVPSVGFVLALALGLQALSHRSRPVALILTGGMLVALSLTTVARNPAWHDDLTLFTTDAAVSRNSAKVRTSAGGMLLEAARETEDPLERARQVSQAVTHLERAVEILPSYGHAWLLLGNARRESGGAPDQVLAAYEHAIEAYPGLSDAYLALGAAARDAGQFDVGLRAYRRLMARQAVDATAWVEMGRTYEAYSRPDSALMAYEQALAASGDRGDVLARMATVVGRDLGDLSRSIQLFEESLEAGATAPWIYQNLAFALSQSGQADRALAVLQRGLRQHPDAADLHRELATAYEQRGDTANAALHRRRARELTASGP